MPDLSDGKQPHPSLGGSEFPVTSWGLILGLQGDRTTERKPALDNLCRRYWKPVFHFVRRAWSKSAEDAGDLTQAFFLWVLEGEALKRFEPDRGGFRTYLKMLLRGFSSNQHQALAALKRGGGQRILSLDEGEEQLKDFLPDARVTTPEQAFDCSWRNEILERTVERTRRWFEDSNRGLQFRVFEEYDLLPAEKPTYAQLAERLGITESAVRNHLFEVRERLRTEIRAELSQTVADFEQLEEEWGSLFGG